jgi:flavin reductase (DIM6/NTAB) family NADH-FMN oxidoreductase RutF
MDKVQMAAGTDLVPMPVVLVATVADGRPNVMTAAWVTKVCSEPPMVALAIGHGQHTNRGIRQTGEFTLNVPGLELVERADACGLVSGREADKAALFELVHGALDSAPMLAECGLSFECRVTQAVELPKDTLFIAEVVAVHADERILTDGALDADKLRPFTLAMPEQRYRGLGEAGPAAFEAGRQLADSARGA